MPTTPEIDARPVSDVPVCRHFGEPALPPAPLLQSPDGTTNHPRPKSPAPHGDTSMSTPKQGAAGQAACIATQIVARRAKEKKA